MLELAGRAGMRAILSRRRESTTIAATRSQPVVRARKCPGRKSRVPSLSRNEPFSISTGRVSLIGSAGGLAGEFLIAPVSSFGEIIRQVGPAWNEADRLEAFTTTACWTGPASRSSTHRAPGCPDLSREPDRWRDSGF